jgi:GT2 family glycosyltransferase
LLRACLDSLPLADPRVEVIVVDSASADGTPSMVAAEFPAVHLIASPDNLGYTRGNNVGLQAARGRSLFILNPIRVLGDALAVMQRCLGASAVGLVGPQLRGRRAGAIRGGVSTLALTFREHLAQRLAPPAGRRYYARRPARRRAAEVDWGGRGAVRRAAWEQVGGLLRASPHSAS